MMTSTSTLPPQWSPKDRLESLLPSSDAVESASLGSAARRIFWLCQNEAPDIVLGVARRAKDLICFRVELNAASVEVRGRAQLDEDDPALAAEAAMTSSLGVAALTAHRSGLLRLWTGEELLPAAAFRAQSAGPVVHLRLSAYSGLLYSASAGADSALRVYNLARRTCLGVMRGVPARTTLLMHIELSANEDEPAVEYMLAGSAEGHVSVGLASNLPEKSNLTVFRPHKSALTSAIVVGQRLVTLGRDAVLAVMNVAFIEDVSAWTTERIIPLLQEMTSMSSAGFLGEDQACKVLCGSADGQLSLWDIMASKKESDKKGLDSSVSGVAVRDLQVLDQYLLVLQDDVLTIKRKKKKRLHRLAMGGGQATDACIVANKHLIVAQGSTLLRRYSLSGQNRTLAVAAWPGQEAVLVKECVRGGHCFVCAGRQTQVSIWRANEEGLHMELILAGHAANIGAVYLGGPVAAAADRDGVLKAWKLPEGAEKKLTSATLTLRAHEKEITCLAGRSEDAVVVSCSPVSISPILASLYSHNSL